MEYLKARHKVTVISTGKAESGKIVLPQFYLPFAKKQMLEMGFLFAWPKHKVLENAFKNADLIHIQFPFLLGYKALKIARSMGKPVVMGFHVQPENLMWNIGLNFDWLNAAIYRLFINSFYNKGDLILAPSSLGKAMLEKFGLRTPVEVVSNGLPAQFKPGNFRPHTEFEDKFVILMVGRLATEKRHNLVIRAIKQSKYSDKIQLVVTGKGPLLEELQKLGDTLPNPAQFTYISQDELIRLFNNAQLFVHASEIELEGMAVMEAIGCGLPALIANSNTSASNQFALNEQFLFAAGNVEQLTARINYWYENPEKLKAARRNYLKKAEQYSFSACAQQTEALYYRALEQ